MLGLGLQGRVGGGLVLAPEVMLVAEEVVEEEVVVAGQPNTRPGRSI